MKKIINGKAYDTEKARKIGEHDSNIIDRLNYVTEALYQKRTGEYFLHGEGGARTKYGRAEDYGRWVSGEEIRPLTAEEARLWAEKNLSADEYETEFGEINEDDSRVAVSITLPRGLVERIRRESAKSGMTVSRYIENNLK